MQTTADAGREGPSMLAKLKSSLQRRSIGMATLVVVILIWDGSVRLFSISRFLLPPPFEVWKSLLNLFQTDWFFSFARITITEILAGFFIATIVAVVLGVALAKSPKFERVANPLVVALQVTPKIAILPLILLVFGFGIASKIAMAAILSFFPILKNVVLGAKSVPRSQIELLRILNASRSQRIIKLEMPFVLPYLLTGLETGIVFAVTGAIVGEYLSSQVGLGALVVISLATLQVAQLFATVIVLAFIGLFLYGTISGLRRRLVPWHESASTAVSTL